MRTLRILYGAAAAVLTVAMLFCGGCAENRPAGENAGKADLPVKASTPPALSPEDADGVFTLAVFPDTQQETVVEAAIRDELFKNRTEWLAENRDELDLRYVIHTGDVVSWGNENPEQFDIASEAFAVLDEAEIPAALCLGNHDTAAVGVGGSAKDPANTRTRVRDTASFNAYFSTERYGDAIPFEDGKIDNAYYLFSAAGKKWMIVTLELWPREEVVEWAKRIVESHPTYNVIVATHSYLNSDGSIFGGSDYGEKSPQYLYDNFISQYENICFVFCGHTGNSAVREDYGENGNKIVSVLGCFHSNTANPVRLLEVDADKGTVRARIYSPVEDAYWSEYDFEVKHMDFIEP
ncbi:MAG: metallophosphoesterase [Eubacteriales bacterium]